MLILSLLLGLSAASAASPLAIYGARARFEGREVFYRPSPGLDLSSLRVESLNLETGRRLPFRVKGRVGADWKLEPNFETLEAWVREPEIFLVSDPAGRELDRTYFQMGSLLDALYRFEGCLGICWERKRPVLRVWAPTARAVALVWEEGESLPLVKASQGVWEIAGDLSWKNKSYRLAVEVFTPASGRVETHLTTDPYSLALTENSRASIVVDPEDPSLKPAGWGKSRPPLVARSDAALYELHVREFSQSDATVPEPLRGTFRAFGLAGTAGDQHLKDLAAAGITHLHLLPVFDFSSVEEDRAQRLDPVIPSGLPADSPVPQQELSRVRALDSFNWGYDPFHYFAPEGSYSVEPAGGARIKEFRELVLSLHRRGLRVVMDVVYNHTFASGLAKESVLDKIVPGYYYRLGAEGSVANSSCCSDTASERWMMEKLMQDSLESWRKIFGVDGFRFDLMNLHSVGTMSRIRDELRRKDPTLLLYGEAWSFGSLLERAPGEAFTQDKSYGTKIGVFNDRIRDAIRGGTTDSKEKSDQGFATGLFYDFNHEPANRNTPVDLGAQREKLLYLTDVVRIGLAGNLRDFRFLSYRGENVTGGSYPYSWGVTGFAAEPEETINYISAHDGYTFFDALQAKLPFYSLHRDPGTAPAQERLERQILSVGMLALSQGIPFFDSGIELLRSKSGDQNSYDSGDWFNELDWSYATNGWGKGLPPQHSNHGDWPFWRPRLAEEALRVGPPEIRAMKRAFLEILRLRKEIPLFRLRSAEEIQNRVRFLDAELGPTQTPGMLVMEISDEGENLAPGWRRVVVTVNATNTPQVFSHPSFRARILQKLYGKADAFPLRDGQVRLPPRSLTVWGEAE
jgi:pullulanase